MKRVSVYASLLAAATLPALFARLHFVAEIFTHFRVQYVAVLLPLALLLLGARRWRTGVFVLAVALWHAAALVPRQLLKDEPRGAKRLTVMSMNLLSTNRDFGRIMGQITAAKPDVLLLLELHPAQRAALALPALGLQPVLEEPREDNFGIGLYAKDAADDAHFERYGGGTIGAAVARFGALTFVGLHPLPPVSAAAAAQRNATFTDAARFLAGQTGPRVLAGDLNLTPWSPWFGDLLTESGLRDTRQGLAWQPSWPADLPLWPALLIPIDHVLVSPEVTVVARAVGGATGSDHFPVIATLSY